MVFFNPDLPINELLKDKPCKIPPPFFQDVSSNPTRKPITTSGISRGSQEINKTDNIINGNKPLFPKNMPVTRTLSDLDTHKESRWASRTSSSNSLASVRALGPSDTDPQFYPIPSAEYLQSEIVRLRQQLQLSREDAARAANRLSQQETELANLRHMLEHMRTKPVGSNVTVQLGVMKNSALNSAGRVRNESSQRTGVGAVSGSNVNRSQTSNRKPNNDPQLVRNSSCALTPAPGATKSVIGSSASSTTFEELDDAMAK